VGNRLCMLLLILLTFAVVAVVLPLLVSLLLEAMK
jgi:hypothetical protein